MYSHNCILFIHTIHQNIKIGTTLKDYARNICSDIDLAIAKACAFERPGMPVSLERRFMVVPGSDFHTAICNLRAGRPAKITGGPTQERLKKEMESKGEA